MSSEAALATRAVEGDGAAFAELYELYESRTFNLCYRITGSYEDAADATQEAFLGVLRRLPKLEGRDVAFGSYVFTAARNACYDLIERRKRTQPSDELPEAATPVGAGPGGGAPPDPRDPGEDPDRSVLLAAQQEEIRAANESLPERQREALALRELEDLSYDEIAEIMGMNRNSVAQLISRARIGLREALRGTAVHSIAPSSSDCERGLPLLAMAQDGQLDAADSGWLDGHLAGCDTCRLSQAAMQEAGASYRAWAPIAAAPWLFRETVANAAELVGADWSEIGQRRGRRRLRHPVRKLLVAAALAVVVLLAGLATTLRDQAPAPPPAVPVAEETPAAEPSKASAGKRKAPPKAEEKAAPAPAEPENVAAEQVVVPGETETRPDRDRREASVDRDRDRSSEPDTEITPTTPDPPPEPPPSDPPPADPPTTTDPPTTDPPTVCFDANGRPVPCPPRP